MPWQIGIFIVYVYQGSGVKVSKCQTAISVGNSRENTKNELLASGKRKKTIKTPKILRASFFDKSSFGHRPLFKNEQFGEIRTIIKDNEPWFVGKDVATVLGYKNASKAIDDHVDEDDKLNNVSLSSLGQRGGWKHIPKMGIWSRARQPSSTSQASTPSSFLPSFLRRRSSSVG